MFLRRFATLRLDLYSFTSVKSSDSDRLTPHMMERGSEGLVCTNTQWDRTSEGTNEVKRSITAGAMNCLGGSEKVSGENGKLR